MKQKIYVFIEENDANCYHNLKQLTEDNPKVPYYTVYRALLKSKCFKKDSYTIISTTMKYTTKRRFNTKEY